MAIPTTEDGRKCPLREYSMGYRGFYAGILDNPFTEPLPAAEWARGWNYGYSENKNRRPRTRSQRKG